jgi:hypothetical protein
MASPTEKLAQSLERLQKLQGGRGTSALRSKDLLRADRERLLKNGFIQEVMKGWYIPSLPDETRGESTAWYACFWSFCASYFNERFGEDWCLSPEQSLTLYAGQRSVPKQLLIRATKANNNLVQLLHGTSILDIQASLPATEDLFRFEGLNLFSLESALISASPSYIRKSPTDARAALSMVKHSSGILSRLLEGGHSSIAGRLAGAFRNIGRQRIADDILASMQAAGYQVRESDPFTDCSPLVFDTRETSPHVNRIKLLWQSMREGVIEHFPEAPGLPENAKGYLQHVDDVYTTDAYNSLSIEGYQVTTQLIERVRTGGWNPDENDADRAHRDAMAARGYWQCFQAVHESVETILKGSNAGEVADKEHGRWYRELFAPSVSAGLLTPSDLAGYRRGQVFIRGSMHAPLKYDALSDVMPVLFELLAEETDAAVRVVLGHFFFVYVHPYMDGNGRIGRFLMNVMLASGGYPWTVIPVVKRKAYMDALEAASVSQDIVPLTRLIAGLVSAKD